VTVAAPVPRRGIGSGDWFLLGSWVAGAVVGYVVAIQPAVTNIAVIAAYGAGVLLFFGLAWMVGRLTGRRMGPMARARGMGAIGSGVVALLAWWVVLLVLNPFVAWGSPLYQVQNFVWFLSGLQIMDLVGRAVELQVERAAARRTSGEVPSPPTSVNPA
jgi:hypothetical protein